ncbi:probable calcium P-type ATPase NCA-3 (Ca2+-transporting ATPase) [Fusarium fujikuroi IMI 58289]|uniref:Calcium-transporting ATPase n=1 Tax=Gibberella fujikuroi (strain CBS 195.34 / IMI 58289 / NRRL A-6831) TaxID=1279085 RepID=S0EAD2_GIBF5|nr:probable calcium P-type ATPase NCA-3 (Ca2+-transporting ATPase) [Fusarium fujikuroi IMI 58289]KLP14840.1 putative calcium P-type ATPase NCA-3 (Ca2+-transporting ATPase) [Fusarium fujikuroi]CCT70717.1 probable calcium P-type ATPase NCA-3 (Ca2+-transporting ATPase) [Fusarium fujikuroi IMI 58289]SCN83611.1 probable calcium P-type ATPase NCA-3 (Ca2+-transporting ATPase) [Fusarium fujikuroi]
MSGHLDPKALLDPRQRSISEVGTISSAGDTTVVPSINTAEIPQYLDAGNEKRFPHDPNNPFNHSPEVLNQLLDPKSLDVLKGLGGLPGLARSLNVDLKAGLSVDELNNQNCPRIKVFGRNQLPAKKPKSIWRLAWITFQEAVLIMLTVAGTISLALGLYETFGVSHQPGDPTPVDWVEGVAILGAVVIVVVVASHNDWQKEKAFVKLNTKKDDREVKVIRSGKSMLVNVADVVVGDVMNLEPGDLIPADGIFIDGHNVKCDESTVTGESDALKKTPGAKCFVDDPMRTKEPDPFIISGSRVLEGMGTFIVTSVGVNSSFGKIMMSVRTDIESTPLQKKLEGLAVAIAKLGGGASLLMFFILLFRFCASLPGDDRPAEEKASTFVDLLVVAIAIIAVAVPEGLPLAVTLALAFATTRLLKENNLVRVLRACETMGNATCICSDKTGTLTTNKMTVTAGRFGSSSFTSDIPTWATTLPPETRKLITQSVAVNSTAFEGTNEGDAAFIGSKTETALLQLAKDHLGMQSLSEARANEQIVLIEPFNSVKKYMLAVIKVQAGYRVLIKGASEIMVSFCSTEVNPSTGAVEALDRKAADDAIMAFARKSLRTIGLVYKDFEEMPDLENLGDLTLLGIVGIQDPVREGVPQAVQNARRAGVVTRMVTGDNLVTARAIATECGIFTDGIVMEGPDFRKLSEEELDKVIPRLQVLARSSPDDKRVLVTRLKVLGETVAVTGDGTNDAPALKAADIGFSMGISGTEVAKEASEIILMDDNFASIITALKWGRAVNDAVQKFLQFQITVNITAVLLSFVTSMYDDKMEPILKAVQLLWINLIMDTMAALALATDPPTDSILDRPPQPKSAPLITLNMWKMIIGQSIFQVVVVLVLYFAGDSILGYNTSIAAEKLQLDTIIFNMFVWMQIFNELNCRRLDNKFNVFVGIHRNLFFILINAIMIGLQIGIIFIGGRVFDIDTDGLNGVQWAISILIAAFSLPWGVLVRIFPDEWFAKVVYFFAPPFVWAYKWMGRGWARFMRLFRKSKKADDEEDSSSLEGRESKEKSSVVGPMIVEPRN